MNSECVAHNRNCCKRIRLDEFNGYPSKAVGKGGEDKEQKNQRETRSTYLHPMLRRVFRRLLDDLVEELASKGGLREADVERVLSQCDMVVDALRVDRHRNE